MHFSYHKCLTVYFRKVMTQALRQPFGGASGYVHLNSHLDQLDGARHGHTLVSVNNHIPDLAALGDVRISRFVRDPRDLLVSGYHYHRRGSEAWCAVPSPTADDWRIANGTVPAAMPAGVTYTEYLNGLSEEAGLLAELEWRTAHFASMAAWPVDDPRILCLDYDDVLGHETDAFSRLFAHYRLPAWRRQVGLRAARRNSASSAAGHQHIRNPESGQWRNTLTDRVLAELDARHPGLIEAYDAQRARSRAAS